MLRESTDIFNSTDILKSTDIDIFKSTNIFNSTDIFNSNNIEIIDISMINIELTLNIPGIYLHTPDCHSCHLDPSVKEERSKRLKTIEQIIDIFSSYMNNILFCNDTQVYDYKKNIQSLLIYLATNKFYSKTTSKMENGQMYLTFSYLPKFLQAYLLSYDLFNDDDKKLIHTYIKTMYYLINKTMMGKTNNWRFGYGRIALLCGYILNDNIIYKNGLNILKYSLTQIKNGFILSEMDRGGRSLIYNCKSANFICDSLYFITNTSNFITTTSNIKLYKNIIKKVTLFTNLIISTAMKPTNDKLVIAQNEYETYTNAAQEKVNMSGLNFINYDLVYNTLNTNNKEYIDNNITQLYKKRIINPSPLAIGK